MASDATPVTTASAQRRKEEGGGTDDYHSREREQAMAALRASDGCSISDRDRKRKTAVARRA